VVVDNVARDPLKFIVASSALEAENEYTFRLAGSSGSISNLLGSNLTELSPFGETKVYIDKGVVVAKIAGGKFRTIYTGDALVLDASSSFDQSIPGETGASAGLKFEWNCFMVSPVLSHECAGFLSGNSETASISTADVVGDVVYSILLDVMDQGGRRQSFAQTKVHVTDHSPAVVTLPTDVTSASMSQYEFDIATVVQPHIGDNSGFSVTWSIDELGDFEEHSTSFLNPGAIVSEYSLFPSRLSGGSSYSLSLSVDSFSDCVVNCLGGKFTLAVVTNFPPSGGSLNVQPLHGDRLVSDFTLAASSWVDEDLPLLYSFFQSASCNSEVFGMLHQKSALSWTSTVLEQGCSTDGFNTLAQVKVTDAFGSSTMQASSVLTVTGGAVPSSSLELVASKLADARLVLDQDQKLQILNIGFTGDSGNESEVAAHVTFSLSLSYEVANSVEYDYDAYVTLVQIFRKDVSLLKGSSISYSYLVDESMLEAVIGTVNAVNSFASNVETSGYDVTYYDPNSQFLSGLSELFSLYNSAAQQTSSRRRLQGDLFTIDSLLTGVVAASTNINDISFRKLAVGTSSFEEYDGFDVRSSKGLYSSLSSDTFSVSHADNVTMLSLLNRSSASGTALTYGISSIQYKDENTSPCENNSVTPCEVQYASVTSVSYINVLRSTGWSQTSEFAFSTELPDVDMPGKRTASTSSEECVGSDTPTVPFDCSVDTIWGSTYTTSVSCEDPDTSVLRYGTWDMTCPVYNTSVSCSSDSSSSCRPVTVSPGVTVCSCDSDYVQAPADTSSTGLLIGSAGYTQFRTEVTSNPVFEVAVVEEPVLVFATPMPSSEPSSIPSATPSAMPSSSPTVFPTAESVPNRAIIGGVGGRNFWILLIAILILLFMLLLCYFCWGRNKNRFWLPWYEVNTNPNWVLRELVDEEFCTFDDDDFSDMLLELDKPFEDTLDDEFISEKRNLSRNYPVLKLRKSSWQEQNMNAGSIGLDIVDFSRKYSGEREMDDLFDELVVPFQTDEACLRDIILVPTALNSQEQQDWMDINDACHDMLIRDMLDEFEYRDTTFEDFIVEIGLGVDHPEGWADINDSFHDLLIRDDVKKTIRDVSVVTMTEELKELFPVEDDVTEEEMLILLRRLQGKIHVVILQIIWLVFSLCFTMYLYFILCCHKMRRLLYSAHGGEIEHEILFRKGDISGRGH
jgi:hypothetical protein